MGQVKAKAGYPVGERCCRAACEEIGQGTEYAKGQPEKAGNDAPEDCRTVVSEGQAYQCQNSPDIEVIEEPHAEAVEESFQKNKTVDHPEYLSAKKDGI